MEEPPMTDASPLKWISFGIGWVLGMFGVVGGIYYAVFAWSGWGFAALIPCVLLMRWGGQDKYGREYPFAQQFGGQDP
jgi:hypothetical protein